MNNIVNKHPFRPVPYGLESLRSVVRYVRKIHVLIRSKNRVSLGKQVYFGKSADIRVPKMFKLGNKVAFGKNFTCEVDTIIGSNVLISSNVSFVSRDHKFDDPQSTVFEGGRDDSHRITIGENVLIGFGVIVIAPVTIGNGCIIGAGAVVSKDLPSNMICAGVPARPIKSRFQNNS